jgi:HSP20 family protein
MTRATKTRKTETSKPVPTSDTSTEVTTKDDRNWMLDLLDWPTWFGRNWRGGLPTGLLDPDVFFADRLDRRFPMRVEQLHDGDDLVIRAELPGIDPDEDVEIGIDGRRMTIEATREHKTETTDDGFRSEFHYGHFRRMMTLPEGADTGAITATYTDGILEVRVPVHAEPETTTKVPVTRS